MNYLFKNICNRFDFCNSKLFLLLHANPCYQCIVTVAGKNSIFPKELTKAYISTTILNIFYFIIFYCYCYNAYKHYMFRCNSKKSLLLHYCYCYI